MGQTMSAENLPNQGRLQDALFAGFVSDLEKKAMAGYRRMADLLESGSREESLAEKIRADILWDQARGRERIIRNFIYDISGQAGISDEALALIANSLATPSAEIETVTQPPAEVEISPEKYRPKIAINENERTWLVNDRLVEWKTGAARDVAFALAKYCKDGNPIDNSEVARLARLAGIKGNRPSAHTITLIRERIEEDPKNPKILITRGRKQKASYLLDADFTFVSQDIKPIVIEVEKKPKTEEEKTIELLGEELWNKLGEVQKRMVVKVGKSTNEAVTTGEWEERVYKDADSRSDVITKPGNRINGNLAGLRDKLISGGWIIDHVKETGERKQSMYRYFLNRKPEDVDEEVISAIEPVIDKKTQWDRKRERIETLPNGETIDKLTLRQASLVNAINSLTRPVSINTLIQSVYSDMLAGKSDRDFEEEIEKLKARFHSILKGTNERLAEFKLQIANTITLSERFKGVTAQYDLINLEVPITDELETIPVEAYTHTQEEVVEIYYTPDERFVIKPEEWAVFRYIEDYFISTQSGMIFLDRLQEDAGIREVFNFADTRIERIQGTGRLKFFYLTARELTGYFLKAYDKLTSQYIRELEVENWSEETRSAWGKLDSLERILRVKSPEELRKKISSLFREAEDRFKLEQEWHENGRPYIIY